MAKKTENKTGEPGVEQEVSSSPDDGSPNFSGGNQVSKKTDKEKSRKNCTESRGGLDGKGGEKSSSENLNVMTSSASIGTEHLKTSDVKLRSETRRKRKIASG